MTGVHMPWWGWLLLVEAAVVLALFQYVRQNLPAKQPVEASVTTHDDPLIRARISDFEHRLKASEGRAQELERLLNTVVAASISERLTDWDAAVKGWLDQLNKRWDHFVNTAKDPDFTHETYGSMSNQHPWQEMVDRFKMEIQQFQEHLSNELGIVMDLTETPRFSENPHVQFAGAEHVSNDRKRFDYNRLYEIHQNVNQKLPQVLIVLSRDRSPLKDFLKRFTEGTRLSEILCER